MKVLHSDLAFTMWYFWDANWSIRIHFSAFVRLYIWE